MYLFKLVWNKWKKIAQVVAIFQARVILTLFYFTILAPFGLVLTFFKDELKIHIKSNRIWKDKLSQNIKIDEMSKQY